MSGRAGLALKAVDLEGGTQLTIFVCEVENVLW